MSTAFIASEKLPIGAPYKPAQFTNSLIGSATVLVTSDGEIDACNARGLAGYIEEALHAKRRLIVDLRGLTFFGTPGFSALHYVNVTCSRRDVNWVLVPGVEVSRMLRICDPQQGLPVADTLERAIAAVSRPPRNHLRPLALT